MPASTQSGPLHNPFLVEPRRGLLTPSASPSVGPPDRPVTKRSRLRSTPSSATSATQSASNELSSSVDVNSARRASTLHVLNVWAQLAERYNKRLDEDDIVDLYSGAIIKDRGVIRSSSTDCQFGRLNQPDDDHEQEDSEQDDDDNELNPHPPSETTTDDDAPVSKKIVLRGVPPLPATTDVEDLREFLEAERERREIAGDEDEVDMSSEQLSALRTTLEEEQARKMAAAHSEDAARTELPQEGEVDITPTRLSTRALPSDDESEDELAVWTHDESTAVYPVAREESEQDLLEVEQEVIELTESDSDAEFEALLVYPPRYSQSSPFRDPLSEEVQQPLQSPPSSGRGRSKSLARSHSKIKSTVTRKSKSQPNSPLMRRKPEVVLTMKKRPTAPEETAAVSSDDTGLDQESTGPISPMYKAKGKEVLPLAENTRRGKTPDSPRVVSRGRKRKRIVSSSTSGSASVNSPERKSSSPSRRKSKPQSRATLPQPNGLKQIFETDASTPVRFESVIQPHSLRPPSQPPPLFSSPNREISGLSPAPYLPPPPIDPAQAQQAHYLLAQAMHQLSYLISATMPTCVPCASNPSQPWLHPSPAPHPAYGTPVHHHPHYHGTCPYHTPSSSISRSGLASSSPVRSSVSPPIEEQRARNRGRSRSQGRRVSFKLNSEEVFVSREHNVQPEIHLSRLKNGKQTLEIEREKGKARATAESDDSARLENQGSPSREVARARTPGPPNRKKTDEPRGRSVGRR